MVKKMLLVLMIVMMIAPVGFASPLTDYSQGKVALDISIRPSGNLSISSGAIEYGINEKNNNFEYGITVGLGNNLAFQYRNSKADSNTNYDFILQSKRALTSQEYNILYKLNRGLSAFAGVTDIKYASDINTVAGIAFGNGSEFVNLPPGPVTLQKSTVGYQVGLIGSTKVADKATMYGIVGVGKYVTNYEIGFGYGLAKNVDLNIGYRDTKYKHQKVSYQGVDSVEMDYIFKGMSYGITYKF